MTAPTDDEPARGSGSPAPETDARAGAHAQPIDVPVVASRPTAVADRRRYFLSSLEPGGEFEAVIVAVTDGGRRRYFTTNDGARMTEVGHDWFDHRSTDGGRSLLELDERELGELEAELEFVRPVRGRDPIAETAETPAPTSEEQTEMTDATEPRTETEPAAGADADAAADATADEQDPVTEELEELVRESRRSTFVQAEAAASVADPAAPEPSTEPSTEVDAVEQVALAKGIAFIAHRGQSDRGGAPYIDHPGRMAERFDAASEPVAAAAAWLHDVLEDTPVTADELFEAGVRPEVIEIVRLLTRTPDVAVDEYYARIRAHDVARRVKLADIDDNSARWRLRRLDYDTQLRLVEKYRLARIALGSA